MNHKPEFTESKYRVLLRDGRYKGVWVNNSVTIPFVENDRAVEMSFPTTTRTPEACDVWVTVENRWALVEPI